MTLVERTRRVVRFTALGEKIADKAVRVLRESEELAELARAEGQPLHGELRMGVIPTIAPFLLPAMLPRLRSEWPTSSCTCARRPAARRARRCIAASSIACCSRSLSAAARSISRRCSTTRSSSPFRAARRRAARSIEAAAIDEDRLLLLEDGHCLKDHALSACNRPELRAHASMMGTSLHTLVQMVDNGLGLTFVPGMAIEAGILDGTSVDARPLQSEHGFRRIALIWRRSSPRESEFQLLAATLRRIARDLIARPGAGRSTAQREPRSKPACG